MNEFRFYKPNRIIYRECYRCCNFVPRWDHKCHFCGVKLTETDWPAVGLDALKRLLMLAIRIFGTVALILVLTVVLWHVLNWIGFFN